MPKPSAGGLVRRRPRATPSLRSTSSCISPISATSSSSSSSSVIVISQVADNFTLPASSSTLTPPTHARLMDPPPDHDVASDACSCSAAPEGGGRSVEFELVPAATVPRRAAAFWGHVRVVALVVRAAVLAAALAVVVAGDVALAVLLFPRREAA